MNNSRKLEKQNIANTKRTDTIEFPLINNYNWGNVEITGLGEYMLSFKKKGDMYGDYSFKMDTILTNFKITLDTTVIKFKEKYQFIIGNYAGKDNLQFTLTKPNSQNYIFEITQFTRYSVTDKIYLKKMKMENMKL